MTLKDYAKGCTAWEINNDNRYGPKSATRIAMERTVTAIGRKYVHCGQHKFYLAQPNDPYLTEEVIFGSSSYLFLTKEQADDYLLHEKLLSQVKKLASSYSHFGLGDTTTKQLATILTIMNAPTAVEADSSSVSLPL